MVKQRPCSRIEIPISFEELWAMIANPYGRQKKKRFLLMEGQQGRIYWICLIYAGTSAAHM